MLSVTHAPIEASMKVTKNFIELASDKDGDEVKIQSPDSKLVSPGRLGPSEEVISRLWFSLWHWTALAVVT